MAVKTQTIRFVMDVARAIRDLERLNTTLDRTKAKVMGGAKGGGGGITGGIGGGVGGEAAVGLAGKFAMLGAATLGLYAAFRAVSTIIGTIAKAGMLVENSIVQMTAFTGSGKEARRLVREAIRDSLTTPYTPTQQISATMKATQFGFDPYRKGAGGLQNNRSAMEIFNALGTFSDAEGRMLGPERAIWGVTQGNKRLLRPFGPDVLNAYEKSQQSGNLGSQAQISAFMVELSKMPKIFDLAINRSKTMEGLWSTITGFADEFLISFTGASEDPGVITFWSQIRDIMFDIKESGIAFFASAKNDITEIGTGIGGIFAWIWDLLTQINIALEPIMPVLSLVYQLLRLCGYLIAELLVIILKFVEALVNLIVLPFRLAAALDGCIGKTQSMVEMLADFITGLRVTFNLFNIFLDGVVAEMRRPLDELVAGWGRVGIGLDALIAKQISNLLYLRKVVYSILNAFGVLSDASLADATSSYMKSVVNTATAEKEYGLNQGWFNEYTAEGLKKMEAARKRGDIDAAGNWIGGGRAKGTVSNSVVYVYNQHPVLTPYLDPRDQSQPGIGVYK